MNNRFQLPITLQRELKLPRTSGVQHVINASLGLSIVAVAACAIMFMMVTIPYDLLSLNSFELRGWQIPL